MKTAAAPWTRGRSETSSLRGPDTRNCKHLIPALKFLPFRQQHGAFDYRKQTPQCHKKTQTRPLVLLWMWQNKFEPTEPDLHRSSEVTLLRQRKSKQRSGLSESRRLWRLIRQTEESETVGGDEEGGWTAAGPTSCLTSSPGTRTAASRGSCVSLQCL